MILWRKIKKKLRKTIERNHVLAFCIFPITNIRLYILYLIRYGTIDPREYFVFKDKGLVYLINSKVAQTTITNTCGNRIKKEYSGSQEGEFGARMHILPASYESDYKFTFVRNPFERLYSCYKSKLITDKQKYKKRFGDLDFYLFGYLRKDRGFENFVRKVVKIPHRLADRHFKPQHHLIYKDNTYPLDFIGRYENLTEEFEPIRERFNLEHLPHLNKSGSGEDWRDAYTPELVELVWCYYKDDCKAWYPNAKKYLLRYINTKHG